MAQQQQQQGSGSGSASASSSSSGLHLLASPFGDTTYTKVFVGGLAWETTSERLRRFYDRFGEILEAVVITDRHSGRSKGYGFVTFRDPESARKACEDPTPVIDGRRANCNLASLGRAQPAVPLGRPRSAGSYFGVPVPRGVYVGGYGQHRTLPLGYYQGFPVPQYSYTTYGTEYIYPQVPLDCSRTKEQCCCICSTGSYLASNPPCIHKVVLIMVIRCTWNHDVAPMDGTMIQEQRLLLSVLLGYILCLNGTATIAAA
ncbi:hypothetical protein OsI_08676 [Oryza sativa Indica Group]|uniref:RRM domain-containing protein n=1 Tax=Oryza sativa subsp. indica TaxID=39946 RepID=A2X8W4_ORYSI|nr:hypothetical protein OsI_08676 [Oryza sativa Indica Group]